MNEVQPRPSRTPRDMALSLVVLLIPVLLIVLAYHALQGGDQPIVIDPAPTVARAQATAAFPVAVPHDLAAGWRPVSATYAPAGGGSTLRIGYLTPAGAGVQLVQSDVPVDALLAAELGAGRQLRGAEEVDGRAWQRYAARHDETAYVRTENRRTIIVIGPASAGELRALAAATG
ncbi:MAG TPA: DUF4245 domain-containing protein [Micromonosporaceae bacterium]|nr:DUF4245 domain-containing protein [Micromonosporaceae bacterium]